MFLHTFASGSSGNVSLVSDGDTYILVDAGISCRQILSVLAALGIAPQCLDALLITHTHSDHISGLRVFSSRGTFPIYASCQSCQELAYQMPTLEDRLQICKRQVQIGSITVTRFNNSHDSPGASGFRFDSRNGESLGILTDTGYITDDARDTLLGVPLLMLEANYDLDMLRDGSYPLFLKQRILSLSGHLSNDDAAAFACETVRAGTRKLVLAHLSEKNNTPELAYQTVAARLHSQGLSAEISIAPRHVTGGASKYDRGLQMKSWSA